ncbi:hypothetical protein [Plantactinospora sp. BB1]|uniref:hypothetical protein n=1 Tax=Plantactinospora sp. BB1 TaxID=2071627 RepID=UPI00131EEEF5|nr:hypothetical protein [Plantactinospora sp. BB1]
MLGHVVLLALAAASAIRDGEWIHGLTTLAVGGVLAVMLTRRNVARRNAARRGSTGPRVAP